MVKQLKEFTHLDAGFVKAVARVFEKAPSKPGAFRGDRVHFIKGKTLVKFLGLHKHKDMPEFKSESDAVEFAKKMCVEGMLSRCAIAEHTLEMLKEGLDARIDLVPVKHPGVFDTKDLNALYRWEVEGSKTGVRFMSFGMIAATAFICMIKIWPLWLKIAVYWTSLTLLITLSSLLFIRVWLYTAMWLLGFRGLWLFPNLLNDDLPFLDAFRPVFGRGVDDVPAAGSEGDDKSWDFGLLNFLALAGLGVWFCWYVGMFDTTAIPDFIVNQQELLSQYPSLAGPVEDSS